MDDVGAFYLLDADENYAADNQSPNELLSNIGFCDEKDDVSGILFLWKVLKQDRKNNFVIPNHGFDKENTTNEGVKNTGQACCRNCVAKRKERCE